MDVKDWIILQTIYSERNITKAAEKLFISQPALTYRIQQIEAEMGVSIVQRNKKGVKFTAEGEYLVKYSKNMLLELQRTKDYLQNMNNNMEGIIRIGVSSNYAHFKLPGILKEFLDIYPKVQFHVKTGWSSEMYNLLYNENVHIGIIRGNYNWTDHKSLISQENICIISNKKIDLDQLPTLPRINYETDPLLKLTIEKWWHEFFTQPPLITMEVGKIETCIEMVVHGLGYAIIPSICIKPNDKLHTINLASKKGEEILRNSWLVYRDSELQFPVVNTFVEFFKKIRGINM